MSVLRRVQVVNANEELLDTPEESLLVTTYPREKQIAEGLYPGANVLQVMGYLPTVSSSRQQVWPVGGRISLPTTSVPGTGVACSVVSSSEQDKHPDNGGGTGLHSLKVTYLDDAGDQQIATVKMNGITPVALPFTLTRVNRLTAGEIGTTFGNTVGNITLYNTATPTTIYGYMLAGRNISQHGFWTVPNGKSAFIEGWTCAVSNEMYGYVEFNLSVTFDPIDRLSTPGLFVARDIFPVLAGTSPSPRAFHPTPLFVPEHTDIRMAVQGVALRPGTTVQTAAYVTMHGFYEDKE